MKDNIVSKGVAQMLIVFYAIMMGHTLFALVVVFVLKGELATLDPANNVLLYIAALVSVGAVAIGYALYKSKINSIKENDEPVKKLEIWRIAFLIKIALIEMTCFLNIIFLMLTNNRIFLYLYILMAIIMLLNKPAIFKLQEELKLSEGL